MRIRLNNGENVVVEPRDGKQSIVIMCVGKELMAREFEDIPNNTKEAGHK